MSHLARCGGGADYGHGFGCEYGVEFIIHGFYLLFLRVDFQFFRSCPFDQLILSGIVDFGAKSPERLLKRRIDGSKGQPNKTVDASIIPDP